MSEGKLAEWMTDSYLRRIDTIEQANLALAVRIIELERMSKILDGRTDI